MKITYRVLAVLFVVSLLTTNVFSEEAKQKAATFILPTIVITPSRMDTTSLKVPGAITVISREEIETSNAQTVTDILRTSGGLIVRDELGNGKSAAVDARGFGEVSKMNVLVLIDGRRINNIDLSGTDWTQIPLDQVEKIEIARGAGSVLYGDNAVAGVINIITKKGEGPLSVSASSLYGSYDKRLLKGEASGAINEFGLINKLSYNINASYSDNNGYRDNNELETKDLAGRLNYDVNDYIGLNVSTGYHEDTYGLPGALLFSDLTNMRRRDAKYPLDYADIRDYYAKMGINTKINVFGYDIGEILTDTSFRQRDSDSQFSGGYESDSDTKVWSLSPQYVFNAEFWKDFKNDLILGVDYFFADHDIHSGLASSEKDDIEITKKTLGFYGLDNFTLFEKFAVQLGYRYEWAKYRFLQIHGSTGAVHNDQIRKMQEGVTTLGVSYYPTEKTSIYGTYAQSYRLPSTDEFYGPLPWGTGLNTNLQPQEADHYEIGAKYYFKDSAYLGVNYFYMDVENEIFYDPNMGFFGDNSNYDKTEHSGVELEAKVRPIDKLALFSNYTFTKPRFKDGSYDGNYIPLVPKHVVCVGGDYTIIDGLIASAVSKYVGSRYRISDPGNDFPKAKPYFVTDVKLGYELKNFEITGGINNLFNEKYAEVEGVSTGREYLYPSPERNYFVSMGCKF